MSNSAGGRSPLGLFPGQPTRGSTTAWLKLAAAGTSRRTEEAYLHWIRRFLVFHNGAHPRELAAGDVNRFLTHLAMERNAAASTHNQALAAVLFLYKNVLEHPLNRIEERSSAR